MTMTVVEMLEVNLVEVLPEYDLPEDVPEWRWIQENASFDYRDNGVWRRVGIHCAAARRVRGRVPELDPARAQALLPIRSRARRNVHLLLPALGDPKCQTSRLSRSIGAMILSRAGQRQSIASRATLLTSYAKPTSASSTSRAN
jgi:hypothetical protein